MKAQLKNVMPNPFRDMDKYPIHPQKVEALKKSIEDTDFWDNIVARKSPTHKGKIEIAYGHHRLVTLKELYAGTEEFNFIVRDLDDEEMLKIMAHENLDEWGHVSDIERETVRAVVYAFAADKIALAKPQGKTPESALRYAPSFCFGCSDGSAQHPYTADTIRDFLAGTMSSKTVQKTLQALCLVEQKHLKESQLKGLTSNQARTLVEETSRAVKQAELIEKEAKRKAMNATPARAQKLEQDAKERSKKVIAGTAQAVSSTIKTTGKSQSDARSAGMQARAQATGKNQKELPEINAAAKTVTGSIHRLLDPEYSPGSKLDELIKYKKHLSGVSKQNLVVALEEVIEYAEGYIARLK